MVQPDFVACQQVDSFTERSAKMYGHAIDVMQALAGVAGPSILQYWQDAAVVKGNPQNTFSFDRPHVRIDYAFLLKNTHWKVTDVQVLPYSCSDHMPVLFTIEL